MADSTTRSKQDIEAEINAARQRLADNVAELISQVQPKAILQRGIDDARGLAAAEFANAKSQVINEDGRLRTERVVLLGGAIAGAIAFLVVVRSLLRSLRRG